MIDHSSLIIDISQKHYKDRAVLSIYQGVIERLLVALRDDEVMGSSTTPHAPSSVVVQAEGMEDSEHVWPPWPWPPWDDDDNDSDDDGHKKPRDPFFRARELAQQVVKFESEIAQATLDL